MVLLELGGHRLGDEIDGAGTVDLDFAAALVRGAAGREEAGEQQRRDQDAIHKTPRTDHEDEVIDYPRVILQAAGAIPLRMAARIIRSDFPSSTCNRIEFPVTRQTA